MAHTSTICRFLCAAALLAAASMAQAVDWGLSDSALHDLSFDATNQLLTSQVLRDAAAQSRGPRASRPSSRSSTLAPARAGKPMAQQLAAHLPAAQRAAAERHYEQLLQGYQRIEARYGIARNDVAGAVAIFVAGNVAAYRGEDFPDTHFKALVGQMQDALASNPGFRAASASARRDIYERLAIIGMSMASTQLALAQRPDAQVQARVRGAARRYLEQFLKTDPQRIGITARGLVIQ